MNGARGGVAAASAARPLEVRRLGRMDYDAAQALQRQLVEQRRSGAISDTLLLVEHPPVITLGARNRASRTHIVAPADDLARAGIAVHEAGRG